MFACCLATGQKNPASPQKASDAKGRHLLWRCTKTCGCGVPGSYPTNNPKRSFVLDRFYPRTYWTSTVPSHPKTGRRRFQQLTQFPSCVYVNGRAKEKQTTSLQNLVLVLCTAIGMGLDV
ncbi:hypothetical protein TMatcc_010443 [Talaromyces marneffei ATCC 18224]